MLTRLKKFMAGLLVLIFVGVPCPQKSSALTLMEEQELSDEFLKAVFDYYQVIDDPVVNDYLKSVGQKILSAMPPQPFEYHFYMIKEDSYNAFAGPGGHIFILSGLFEALDNEDELAGLLTHEIAHVSSRHISEMIEKSKKTSMVTLAGVVAGILMGLGGAATAGTALTVGSMAAGQTMQLAYSRENEIQADQIGRSTLVRAGYDLHGLLAVLKKIRATQWYGTDEIPTYLLTHPATEERIIYLSNMLEDEKDPHLVPSYAFSRTRARVAALYGHSEMVLERFRNRVEKDPNDAMARYGYALALARNGSARAAIPLLKQAIAQHPEDPFLKADLGRIYYLSGQYEEAIKTLNSEEILKSDNPEAWLYLGRSQFTLERYDDSAATLEQLVMRYPDYKEGLFALGKTLGKQDRLGDAHYYLGLYSKRENDIKTARFHFSQALETETDKDRIKKIKEELESLKNRRTPPPEEKESIQQVFPSGFRVRPELR